MVWYLPAYSAFAALQKEIAMKSIQKLLLIPTFVSLVLISFNPVFAFEEVNTTIFGVAIKGYDTVAYHTMGQALKGSSNYAYKWNDAKWYFSSKEHKDLFIKDPEKYAPRYGGYWARNLANTGKAAGANPKSFKIIEGRLYLNYSSESADAFEENSTELISKADQSWEKLQAEK